VSIPVRLKGKCLFIGEPRKVQMAGREPKVCKEFGFLIESPGRMPEMVKVTSWNGFNPKLNDAVEFEARVSARVWKGQAEVQVEVI